MEVKQQAGREDDTQASKRASVTLPVEQLVDRLKGQSAPVHSNDDVTGKHSAIVAVSVRVHPKYLHSVAACAEPTVRDGIRRQSKRHRREH